MANVSDNFNRANEALTAGPWAVDGGDWTVTSNEALAGITGTRPLARHATALSGSDHRVTAKYLGGQGGLLARASSDLQSGYFCTLFDGSLLFWKVVGGTKSFIGDIGTLAVSAGDTIYFEVEGTALRIGKVAGSEVSITDSSITTGTFAGMASDSAINLDDWTAEDLGGEPPSVTYPLVRAPSVW